MPLVLSAFGFQSQKQYHPWRKMKKPFRRYKPWKVDWSNYEEEMKNLPGGTIGINTKLDTD